MQVAQQAQRPSLRTDDTLYENSETAIIAINTVSGGGATESGTQSVTIAITDKALDSGTQATYDANNESTWLNAPEFYQSDYGADNRATDLYALPKY